MSADHTSLSALVELSGKVSDGVILFDSNEQKITHINGAARMMTGLKAGSTIDDVKGLLDTMPADDLPSPDVAREIDQERYVARGN